MRAETPATPAADEPGGRAPRPTPGGASEGGGPAEANPGAVPGAPIAPGTAAAENTLAAAGVAKPRPERDARRLLLLEAAAALAGAAAIAAWHARRHPVENAFPRSEAEFLPAAESDRRLVLDGSRIKADPGDLEAWADSGLMLFQKGPGRYPDAINALEEARRLGALDARIFYYLGVMYQQEGLYSFAASELEKFLRNRPDDADARLLLAKLEFQEGEYEDAAAHYRRLSAAHPGDPMVAENLALSLWKLHRGDEAASILRGLRSADAASLRRAHFYLGEIAFERADYRQALRDFAMVSPVEAGPAFGVPPPEIHAALAANFEKLKLYREAKDHWDRTLRYDPKNSRAKAGSKAAAAALKAAERSAARRRPKRKKKK